MDLNTNVAERAGGDLGSSVEAGGFRVDSMTPGHDPEALQETIGDFLESEGLLKPGEAGKALTPPDVKTAEEAAAEKAAEKAAETKKRGPEGRLDAIHQRIAAATRERHTVDGELAAKRAELAALDRQLQEARGGASPNGAPAQAAGSATTPKAADDPRPRWTGEKGFEAQGKTYEDYEAELEAWQDRDSQRRIDAALAKVDERLNGVKTEVDQRRIEEWEEQRHQARVAEILADPEVAEAVKSEDFTKMPVTPFLKTVIRVHDKGHELLRHIALNPAEGYAMLELPITPELKQTIRESPDPVKLLSHLANHPDEADRIARLSGTAALRALWALETSPPDAKAGTSAAANRQPSARPLPAKVQASRSTAPARPKTELSTDDFDEFIRREEAGEND